MRVNVFMAISKAGVWITDDVTSATTNAVISVFALREWLAGDTAVEDTGVQASVWDHKG